MRTREESRNSSPALALRAALAHRLFLPAVDADIYEEGFLDGYRAALDEAAKVARAHEEQCAAHADSIEAQPDSTFAPGAKSAIIASWSHVSQECHDIAAAIEALKGVPR